MIGVELNAESLWMRLYETRRKSHRRHNGFTDQLPFHSSAINQSGDFLDGGSWPLKDPPGLHFRTARSLPILCRLRVPEFRSRWHVTLACTLGSQPGNLSLHSTAYLQLSELPSRFNNSQRTPHPPATSTIAQYGVSRTTSGFRRRGSCWLSPSPQPDRHRIPVQERLLQD